MCVAYLRRNRPPALSLMGRVSCPSLARVVMHRIAEQIEADFLTSFCSQSDQEQLSLGLQQSDLYHNPARTACHHVRTLGRPLNPSWPVAGPQAHRHAEIIGIAPGLVAATMASSAVAEIPENAGYGPSARAHPEKEIPVRSSRRMSAIHLFIYGISVSSDPVFISTLAA